jgi:hypothetical protein
MAIHTVPGAYAEIVGQWGHGRNEHLSAEYCGKPGHIVSDDGDGNYTAWRFEGAVENAAFMIGRLEIGYRRSEMYIASLIDGYRVTLEPAPAGFGRAVLDGDGEIVDVIYDADEIGVAHPDVVAWG